MRPLYEPHPFDGVPGVIGGNCRKCVGPVIEPWHQRPHPNIGQPCGGWACDGHNDLCPDCDESYRDYYESMRPY